MFSNLSGHSGLLGGYQQSYRYVVLVGSKKVGFSKVSGLKYSAPMEPLKVGGLDRPLMVRAAGKSADQLTFEYGMCYGLARNFLFVVGKPVKAPMSVVTLTEQRTIGRVFIVEDPIVESWEMSELNAVNGEVVIEKFSVYHSGIFEG